MSDHTERVIERVDKVGRGRMPDADRDKKPLSPDERDDIAGAREWVDKLEFRAPIGGPGKAEPEPSNDTFEVAKRIDKVLDQLNW